MAAKVPMSYSKRLTLPTRPALLGLRLYVQLVLALTSAAFLYLAELQYAGSSFLQAGLWSPQADRFGDFWHYRHLLTLLHQPAFFAANDRFAYPAPCALVYQVLYALHPYPHVWFNLMLWTVEGISAFLLFRALHRAGMRRGSAIGMVFLMVLTSYPWHTLYDRGNIELFVYVLIASGVWAYLLGRPTLAAVLWGCAGALKIYPLLLFAVYAERKSSRSFLVGAATFIGILFFSFWYVGPTVKLAASGTMWGIRGFVGTYGAHTRYRELVLDHSFLGGMKEILALPWFHVDDRQIVLSHFYEAIVILAGPPLFLRWRRHAPLLNQLCLLLVLIMLLPPVSYDYTLIYMYLVMGIVTTRYLAAALQEAPFPARDSYFVCFAILSTPENWINILGFQPNGLLKAAALLMLAVNLVRFPLYDASGKPSQGTVRQPSLG